MLITIVNKLVGTFGVYRNYIDHEEFLKHFKLTGWEYICSIGKYKKPTNQNARFTRFCEKIEMLQYGRLMTLTGDERLYSYTYKDYVRDNQSNSSCESKPSTPLHENVAKSINNLKLTLENDMTKKRNNLKTETEIGLGTSDTIDNPPNTPNTNV